ncbi:unnamed protein product [Calypogeia fissa]
MGCGPLLDLTWGYQSEDIVREVANNSPPSQFPDSIRAIPGKWTVTLIAEALGLNSSGEGLLAKAENLTKPYFAGEIDAKEGWRLSQCSDPKFQAVLSFLIPILSPQKPRRVTVRVGSTIVAAYTGLKVIFWPKILEDVIALQARSLHLKTPTSLSCYLAHLYAHQNVLTKEEMESFESLSYLALMGDPDAVMEEHTDSDTDKEDVPSTRPPLKRKLSQSPGPGRTVGPGRDFGPGGHPDVSFDPDLALRPGSSVTVSWLPSTKFRQADIWLSSARAKVDNLENMLFAVAGKLDCTAPEILSTLEETLVGASKGRIAELEVEKLKDQARITRLEGQLSEVKKHAAYMEGMETRLIAAIKELEPLFLLSALDLTQANLVEKYLASATPAVFSRVVSCNAHFAGMIKNSFLGLKECIVELGPLIPRSGSEEDEEDVDPAGVDPDREDPDQKDPAQTEPPMEPDFPVDHSRPSSPAAPTPAHVPFIVVPAPPRAPTIEELARQAIPEGEPPSYPFVTTTSGVAYMAVPLASSSGGMAPRLAPD